MRRIWFSAVVALFGLTACATKPPASNPDALAAYNQTNDPLEPLNRKLYAVNDTLDTYGLKPIAKGYAYVVPRVVRGHIGDVLSNLNTPVVFLNDILEAKSRRAGDSLVRFVVNSTVGVAGVFDVATGLGYPSHEADFGITLALWGRRGRAVPVSSRSRPIQSPRCRRLRRRRDFRSVLLDRRG